MSVMLELLENSQDLMHKWIDDAIKLEVALGCLLDDLEREENLSRTTQMQVMQCRSVMRLIQERRAARREG